MLFNLNEYLVAVSFALDFVEMDLFGIVTNHSKRVAYLSMKIAQNLSMTDEEVFDMVSLAILHDNGASEKALQANIEVSGKPDLHAVENVKEHGLIGERNVKGYPFLNSVENVIKYHHENYDGTGYFKLRGDEIPLMSQIIKLADIVELNSDLRNIEEKDRVNISTFVKAYEGNLLSPKVVAAFLEIIKSPELKEELKDDNIDFSLKTNMPAFRRELTFKEIRGITKVFSKIIDSKSKFTQSHSEGLAKKVEKIGRYYNKPEDELYKLIIAADLHDIGKLAVKNEILDKPGMLSSSEFEIVKKHPYLTRVCLQAISGFEEITEWAANHHEKLDGSGYPYGKQAYELDFNSRLLACLDIYQACTEDRPYRKAMQHKDVIHILKDLARKGSMDQVIIDDIDMVFSGFERF